MENTTHKHQCTKIYYKIKKVLYHKVNTYKKIIKDEFTELSVLTELYNMLKKYKSCWVLNKYS